MTRDSGAAGAAVRLDADAVSDVLQRHPSSLSDETISRLESAQEILDAVFADQSVSADETDDLADAAAVVTGVIEDEFVKLADQMLEIMADEVARLDTLIEDGSFAYKPRLWSAVFGAVAGLFSSIRLRGIRRRLRGRER